MKQLTLWRLITGFIFALVAVLAFFGWPLPKDFTGWTAAISQVENWWANHANHPVLSAFLLGASLSLLGVPALVSILKNHFFPPTYEADISAIDAFNKILSTSKWARENRKTWKTLRPLFYESGKPKAEIIEGRLQEALARDIHDKLAQGKIESWASADHDAPEEKLPSEEWKQIEIKFDQRSRTSFPKNACAWYRNKAIRDGGHIKFVNVRFSRKQIDQLFPRWFHFHEG